MTGPVHLKQVSLDATFVCTKVAPWKGRGRGWLLVLHPDTIETRRQVPEWPGLELLDRRCPNCRHEWEAEFRCIRPEKITERG